MIRFALRALLGVPVWLLYLALMTPLITIGVPLIAVLALYMQLRFKYTGHTRTHGKLRFPAPFGVRLFYLWDNDEDGVDGDPWLESGDVEKNPEWFEATSSWSLWRKIFVWSAWRNSVGNARRLPFFGLDMADPKGKVVTVPPFVWTTREILKLKDRGVSSPPAFPVWWKEYRKTGPYLARYGYRFELRFPWSTQRFFWIGWRIAQQDAPNTDIGFAFQPFAKL